MNAFTETVKQKTNSELLTMVYAFEEWSPEMQDAVQAELAYRNMLPADVAERKQAAIADEAAILENGKAASVGGIILGWIGVLGLLGLLVGYTYAFSKTRSKYTGKQYYRYDAESRKTGTQIFYTALAAAILFLFFKIATLH